MKTSTRVLKSLIFPALFFIAACSSEKPVVTAPAAAPPPPAPAPAVVMPQLGDVFFDFDKSALRTDAREQLDMNAKWLQANASKKVTIEGHCDERGTSEYNLALGERRARSAKDYLVNLGADSGRLTTISYGEEKPFALGHNEEAWAQNRRDHFVVQ